jgi:hypothetical protein
LYDLLIGHLLFILSVSVVDIIEKKFFFQSYFLIKKHGGCTGILIPDKKVLFVHKQDDNNKQGIALLSFHKCCTILVTTVEQVLKFYKEIRA